MKKLFSLVAAPLVFGGLLLHGTDGRAQVFSPPAGTTVILPDTAEARQVVVTPAAKKQKAAADSAKRTEHMFRAFGYPGIRLTRPGKAALLAALLPGAGQIYNRSWWKLPLVYGGVGAVFYAEYFYQTRYTQFAEAIDIVSKDQSKLHSTDLAPVPRQFNSLEALQGGGGIIFYRGNRDLFLLYSGVAYGLQIVDALVDAHLKNFDVSDDLSLHWEPTLLRVPGQASLLPTAPGVAVALRLK